MIDRDADQPPGTDQPSGAEPSSSDQRPAAGSHDRSVPTGTLEVSAANLFEATVTARDAEERGDSGPLEAFYRTLMSSTLLLPIPADTREETRAALEHAVHDADEVELGVMLARDPEGQTVSVLFGSQGALAAWAPIGTGSLPLPARIVFANLAASGLPAIMDPSGPIPYRFEPDEIAELAAGRLPTSGEPLFPDTARGSVRLRLPGTSTDAIEAAAASALRGTDVEAAYLVERDLAGERRMLVGLTDPPPAGWRLSLPSDAPALDVAVLDEPLLGNVRALTAPFYRRGRR